MQFSLRLLFSISLYFVIPLALAQNPGHGPNAKGGAYFDLAYINQIAEHYYNSKDESCSRYKRESRKSPFSLDYLKLFAHNAAERLCGKAFSEEGQLNLYSKAVTSYKGDFTDVLKRVPGVTQNKFSKGGATNIATLYAMNLALSMDETDGNTLAPKHTGSTQAFQWEAGLGHLSTNALYAETLAPKDGVSAGPKQKPMRNLLADYASKIKTSLDRADSAQGTEEFSQLCGYPYFTSDYWTAVDKLVPTIEFPDGSPVLIKSKSGEIKSLYTPERGMRELRNIDLSSFISKLQEAIDKETTVDGTPKKLVITEEFLKTIQGSRFSGRFRHLLWYCPKLAIELQGLSLRLNSTHQGSILRNALNPHCTALFEEIFKNEAKVCGNVE